MRGDHLILIVAVAIGGYLGWRWQRRQAVTVDYTAGPLLGYGSFFRGHPVALNPGPAATWGLGVPNIAGGG